MPRRNTDAEVRSATRRAAASPLDVRALEQVGLNLLRADPLSAVLPDPPITHEAFEDLCDHAFHAGRDLREFMAREGAKFVLQRPDLEILSAGSHERLRLFSSYPRLGNAQLTGVSVAVSEINPDAPWARASIAALSPISNYGGANPARVSHVNDSASLLLTLPMKRLVESGEWDLVAQRIVTEGEATTRAARNVLEAMGHTGPSSTDAVDSLALAIRRAVHNLVPPSIERPSESDVMTPEAQEDLARSLVPAIAAGGELAAWVQATRGVTNETYRWIVDLSSVWNRGDRNAIPDTPTARLHGAVGAIPLQWAIFGGRVVSGESRRRHDGGRAALVFCRNRTPRPGERRCGFASGEAGDLLTDDLRWSGVMNNVEDFFRAGGHEPL